MEIRGTQGWALVTLARVVDPWIYIWNMYTLPLQYFGLILFCNIEQYLIYFKYFVKLFPSTWPYHFLFAWKLFYKFIFKPIFFIDILGISWEISLQKNHIDNKSTLAKEWLGAIRQQSITLPKVKPDLSRHLASLGHNKLMTSNNVRWKWTPMFPIYTGVSDSLPKPRSV